ncbi:MAG: hypothetical protein RIR97_1243 [Pseudomonadota bacterium]
MLTRFGLPGNAVLKQAAITLGLEAAAVLGNRRFGLFNPGRGIIFTLHHVRPAQRDGFDPNAHLEITPDFLEDAILTGLECGFQPVALDDLPDYLADPSQTKPAMVFTLDDGYLDNAEHAMPVFERHSIPFTVFVATGFMDRIHAPWWETLQTLLNSARRFDFEAGEHRLSFDLQSDQDRVKAFRQIRTLISTHDEQEMVATLNATAERYGVNPFDYAAGDFMTAEGVSHLSRTRFARIGAHTVSHRNLRRLSARDVQDEMVASASRLEEIIGYRPKSFAYPYGFDAAVSQRDMDLARDCGFHVAVTTQPALLNTKSPARITGLPRVSLNGFYQKKRYVRALASGILFGFQR